MKQIKLTKRQIASMKTDHPWLKATKEQESFIKSCPNDHRVMLYGDTFLLLPAGRADAAMKAAFEAATNSALQMLGITERDQVEDIDCDSPALGQTYLRVTVRGTNGQQASAIGMIPDPRGH